MAIQFTTDGTTLHINAEDSDLLELDDAAVSNIAKLTADIFNRRRNKLLCERDGHLPDFPDFMRVLCDRCGEIIDQKKYDEFVAQR